MVPVFIVVMQKCLFSEPETLHEVTFDGSFVTKDINLMDFYRSCTDMHGSFTFVRFPFI